MLIKNNFFPTIISIACYLILPFAALSRTGKPGKRQIKDSPAAERSLNTGNKKTF
jgi:hypothetical protein